MTTFCEYCNRFVDTHIEEYTDTIKVKDVPIKITAQGAYCAECHNQLFNRDLDNEALLIAYREYRNEKGLLQPEDIKRIRMKYGLSQVAFAKLLGFGEKTIARYEGGSLQDEAPNSLIYLMDKPTNMLEMLNKHGKDRLNENELQAAMKAIKNMLYYDVLVYKTNLEEHNNSQNTYITIVEDQIGSRRDYRIRASKVAKKATWRCFN